MAQIRNQKFFNMSEIKDGFLVEYLKFLSNRRPLLSGKGPNEKAPKDIKWKTEEFVDPKKPYWPKPPVAKKEFKVPIVDKKMFFHGYKRGEKNITNLKKHMKDPDFIATYCGFLIPFRRREDDTRTLGTYEGKTYVMDPAFR